MKAIRGNYLHLSEPSLQGRNGLARTGSALQQSAAFKMMA